MHASLRRHLSTFVAVVVTALLVGGGPPLAAAVFDAVNADKVDGRHAVPATATAAQRAGKLVATNSAGRLPNTIIAKAPDADRLDGLDVAQLQRRVNGTCSNAQKVVAVGAAGGVACSPDLVDNGDAATIDGLDSVDLLRRGVRTRLIRPDSSQAQNGLRLVQALADLTPPAEGTPERWVIKLEPGVYDVSNVEDFDYPVGLRMQPFVDIEGSGPGTEIVCVCGSDSFVQSATVQGAADAELRDLTVVNVSGGGTYAMAVGSFLADGEAVSLRDVTLRVIGLADNMFGVYTTGRTSISRAQIAVHQGGTAYGIYGAGGEHTISDSTIIVNAAQAGDGVVLTTSGSSLTLNDSNVNAGGGTTSNRAFVVGMGSGQVWDSALMASGPGATALFEGSSLAGVRVASSQVEGSIAGNPACVHTYTAALVPLDATCVPPP